MLSVAEALGKFEHEVLDLTPEELARWVAYFKIKRKAEERAMRKARSKSGRRQ